MFRLLGVYSFSVLHTHTFYIAYPCPDVPHTVLDLGQMRPCTSQVMRPLTFLALKEVDPVSLHRQSDIHAQEIVKF